jgi:hypothetical protein
MPAVAAVELLDDVYERVAHDTEATMARLWESLDAMKWSLGEARWREFVEHGCRTHPLKGRLEEDPFTAHSVRKPRGYPGDAALLDFLYLGLSPELERATTPLGRRIFQQITGRTAPARAVRRRRDLLASRLDRLADARPGARALSVACGHLHEARMARGVRERRLGELAALDQDPVTLARLADLVEYGVTPVRASVKDILQGRVALEGFDFVYAAGLYDYLPEAPATQLTTALFAALNPGAELLIGNFLTGYPGCGYMESFMQWRLITRTTQQLARCLDGVPPASIAASTTWEDVEGCVAYLVARKAG